MQSVSPLPRQSTGRHKVMPIFEPSLLDLKDHAFPALLAWQEGTRVTGVRERWRMECVLEVYPEPKACGNCQECVSLRTAMHGEVYAMSGWLQRAGEGGGEMAPRIQTLTPAPMLAEFRANRFLCQDGVRRMESHG